MKYEKLTRNKFIIIAIIVAIVFSVSGTVYGSWKRNNCGDSDYGIDYYTKGSHKYNLNFAEENHYEYFDSCSKDRLNERTCTFFGKPLTVYYECPNGCEDGVCIN